MDERDPIDDGDLVGPPATPDTLREIVARHRRGRTRALGIALAVAVIAGPLAGWAVGHGSRSGSQQVATGSPPTTGYDLHQQKSAEGAAIAPYPGPIAVPSGVKPRRLFTRTTADGITIRAYRSDPPKIETPTTTPTSVPAPKAPTAYACVGRPVPAPAPEAGHSTGGAVSSSGSSAGGSSPAPGTEAVPPQTIDAPPVASPPCPGPFPCTPSPSLMTELSNDAAVGQGFVPLPTDPATAPLTRLSTSQFGIIEGSPVTWAVVRTGPGVATVRLQIPSGGTDQMAPVEGLAVVAHGSTEALPAGTVVEALDGSGKVVDSFEVSAEPSAVTAYACAVGATARATASASGHAVPPPLPPTTR